MKQLCFLFIATLFSCMSCIFLNKENQTFSEQTVKGKYPFDKCLKFNMIFRGKKVPFSVYAEVYKNRITSLQIGQEYNQPLESEITYQDLITFVSSVILYLNSKEDIQAVTQLYTNMECWREVSKEMTRDFLKHKGAKNAVESSRLLKDLTEILKSNGFEVKDVGVDLVVVEPSPTMFSKETSPDDIGCERLCGQIFIDVERSHD